jgi:hypothetical protein
MISGRHYSVRYVLDALKRRWLLIALPFLVIAGVAVLLARTLPDVYYAQGTIAIGRQQIPDAYVRTTVIVPFAERLRNTITELKRASRLEALINEFDLYHDARQSVPMEALTAWMARQITVSMAGADTIVVGYSGYDPAVVAKVADRLLEQMVQLSSGSARCWPTAPSVFSTSKFVKRVPGWRSRNGRSAPIAKSLPGSCRHS